MCKSVFYVGVDVGKDEVWASMDGYRPRSFKNTPGGAKALREWCRKISPNQTIHFCMEATGVYGRSLAVRLFSFADTETSIVNPAQINSYAKAQLRRSKTDSVDSQVILSFAQTQKPHPWKPEAEAIWKLYQLVSQADVLEQQIQEWANRQHAHSHTPDLPKEIRNCDKALQRTLKRQLEKIERAIDQLIEEDSELSARVDLLCSFKGIAKKSAVRIIGYSRDAMTERSARALVAHAGLAPRHHQSGTSVHGRSHIAKQGDKRLRKALYMPALVAMVHNPVIRNFYQRLLQNGKAKKLAITACMKKILVILRAMIKTNKPFNPNMNA
jgi:transposase